MLDDVSKYGGEIGPGLFAFSLYGDDHEISKLLINKANEWDYAEYSNRNFENEAYFLKKTAQKFIDCAFREAASRGHAAVVERMLEDDLVDPSANDNLAIGRAAYFGHLAVVERLLKDDRVDPSAKDNEAIGAAAVNGHLAVVERLLEDDRVDPSADNNYAVHWAAKEGHIKVVELLLEDERVDVAVAIRYSPLEQRKRFECRERLTEICIGLQDMQLPAWVTIKILKAARPWSTLSLHSKWALVCGVKHFHDKRTPP
jgi:phosphopantetheinyl transferase (holo-ACP synthase)